MNDGSPSSGAEVRSAELLAGFLDVPGIELQRFEPAPGRVSLLARLSGATPAGAPHLLLMGHTDVVPVEETGWQRDPFGGEVVEGWIWGRGAVDMLNLTASMAVALRALARDRSASPLAGALSFLAVADEEALGTYGAKWLTETEADTLAADAVITESGGIPIPIAGSTRVKLPVLTAEKGVYWCRLTVRGTPGHASRPWRSDNAVVTAAEVVRRLHEYRTPTQVPEHWKLFVEGMEMGSEWTDALTDPDRIGEICHSLPLPLAKEAHSSTHTTIAPTVCHGGEKTNVIPGFAQVDVDIRTLPGQPPHEVRAILDDALGDLRDRVTIDTIDSYEASASSMKTPLWECLARIAPRFYEGSATVPMLSVGATDAHFFRHIGIPSYGFGMFSRKMSLDQFASMFHGNDERVDIESLVMSTRMWEAVARDFLG